MQNTIKSNFRSPIVYQGLTTVYRFKVSSETHGYFLTIISYEIKIKSKSQTHDIQWHDIYIMVSEKNARWVNNVPKQDQNQSWDNYKLYISMSTVKALFRYPTPFLLCWQQHTSFSWAVPLSSLSWQVSHDSVISNTVGSTRQSRLHFYSFMQWPF